MGLGGKGFPSSALFSPFPPAFPRESAGCGLPPPLRFRFGSLKARTRPSWLSPRVGLFEQDDEFVIEESVSGAGEGDGDPLLGNRGAEAGFIYC